MKNILDEKLTTEWDKCNPSFSDVSTKTKVKWNCSKCFNSWEAVIANRLKGSGCPYCSGRLAKAGVNDLQTLFADLSEQWSHKNGNLKPNTVKPNSNIKVWWLCDKNHEWEATIASRVRQNLGCPICAGKKILAGFNDFSTHYPDLLKEWDFEKNVMSPQTIASQSHKEVWWVCSENHSWLTRLSNRTAKNSGCPYCSGSQPVPGLNDFLSNYPHLLKEWDFEKNKNAVTNFSGGSGKKVWWKCHRGHGWEAAIKDRTFKERGCPICANRQVLKGFNDLSTKSLTLSKEWHPTKNAISPEEITAGSDKKVWWMCDKNHEWEATVDNRSKGQSCPYCSNKKVLPGFNDLATISSHLVDEWDFEKNSVLTPHEVTAGSSKKVWWKCKKNHSWEATPNDRKIYGCLDCYRKTFVSQPEKDIKEFLQQHGVKVVANSRHLINKELDLYLPDYNLAIEFNGLYWHDEKHKTKNYHYDKWLACKNKNVQLIQVWEDDWNCNPELIKNMILHKIGASTQQKIYARKTETVILNKNEAETFLKQNHIQGFVTGSFYLGLKTIPQKLQDEQEIVSVLVMKKEEKEKHYSLLRYATSRNVVGGFTKLLNYFERTCHPIRITTFSDNCVSDGKLYKSNSFSEDKILAPDYMYVVKGRRVHKFNYRLKKFKNNPNLQYIEGLTEKQLADLNNLNRIWDAGKTRWVKCYDDRKKI